jgi:hypothetical protein
LAPNKGEREVELQNWREGGQFQQVITGKNLVIDPGRSFIA